jgi:RNA polymerase sigma-70 factor (sigma-E family)
VVAVFETWVTARAATLGRTAYLLTGDSHLAEDLLQDTLARVAERWTRISRDGDPDAYARRVMYHLSIDWWRRRRSRPDIIWEPPPELAENEDSDTVVRRLVLHEALGRLTARQRAVLMLRFLEDLTEIQTAEVMGCSANTVKSQTRHALTRLRALAPDLLDDLRPEATRQ